MLTLIVFTPLIGALALLFVNKDDAGTVRNISVGAAGFTFLVSLVLKLLPGFLCFILTIR